MNHRGTEDTKKGLKPRLFQLSVSLWFNQNFVSSPTHPILENMNQENPEAERTKLNELSHHIIGLCMEVHRELGPGLLESAYEEALAYEFTQAGLPFERQREMPLPTKA